MQVFIEIPYSKEVFAIIRNYNPDNIAEMRDVSDSEYSTLSDEYDDKLNAQYMFDSQSWVNKYITEGDIKVKDAFCTGNETIQFEIEIGE
jgi:hypothetical protein